MMYNYLKYKSLVKVFFIFILIGSQNKVQAQTDSLLQTLLVDEKIDNLLSVLDWNLRELTSVDEAISDLFVFE